MPLCNICLWKVATLSHTKCTVDARGDIFLGKSLQEEFVHRIFSPPQKNLPSPVTLKQYKISYLHFLQDFAWTGRVDWWSSAAANILNSWSLSSLLNNWPRVSIWVIRCVWTAACSGVTVSSTGRCTAGVQCYSSYSCWNRWYQQMISSSCCCL